MSSPRETVRSPCAATKRKKKDSDDSDRRPRASPVATGQRGSEDGRTYLQSPDRHGSDWTE